MRKIMFFVAAIVAMALTACSGGSGDSNWQAERDSIMNVNEQQRQVLDDLTASLVEVSSSLDSIAVGEGALRDATEGPVLTKRQMLENLATFKETLAQNKERLAELERQLAGRNDQLAQLNTVVRHLREELETKEARIAQLEEELQSANADINRMRNEMNDMSTTIGSLQEENDAQRQTMEQQTVSLNTAYYIIGTSRELKDKGLVTGGNLLHKKKVNYDTVDQSLFVKIDMRSTTQINIPSKKVKILTEVPNGSYTQTKNGNSTTIEITDVARFWSISRYLIIQID